MLLASGDPGAVQMEPDWPVNGLCALYNNVEREWREEEHQRPAPEGSHGSVPRHVLYSKQSQKVSVIQKKKKKTQFPYKIARAGSF